MARIGTVIGRGLLAAGAGVLVGFVIGLLRQRPQVGPGGGG